MFLFVSGASLGATRSFIQKGVENEYGDCYKKFKEDIEYCTPSSCVYPDLSGAKAWKAHVVRGMVNQKCYVIYYSYIGSNIIGKPQHCLYDDKQLEKIYKGYRDLFTTKSAFHITDIKHRLNEVNNKACQVAK